MHIKVVSLAMGFDGRQRGRWAVVTIIIKSLFYAVYFTTIMRKGVRRDNTVLAKEKEKSKRWRPAGLLGLTWA